MDALLVESEQPDSSESTGGSFFKRVKDRCKIPFLVFQLFCAGFIVYDTYNAWDIFCALHSSSIPLPTGKVKRDLMIAWGVFAALGVLTCLCSLWDMMVDCLEDFGKAERLYPFRLAPHYELLLVSFGEELFQSAILLWVLTHYGVEMRTPSLFTFMNKAVFIMISDFLSIVFRIAGAVKKLYEKVLDVWKHPKQIDSGVIALDLLAVMGLLAMLIAFSVLKHNTDKI